MLWFEHHLIMVIVCIGYLMSGETEKWVCLGDRGSRFVREMEVVTEQ